MMETLGIIGMALGLDFLITKISSRFFAWFYRPQIFRVEETPFGLILVCDDAITDEERREILEAFESLNRGSRDLSAIRQMAEGGCMTAREARILRLSP